MTPRVRIAPSPTGDPHVGTAYIALFNMAFAKHHGGSLILRIEDTDQGRSRPEYEENIFNALRWCNISWEEGPDVGGAYGPYRQSERTEIYQKHTDMLLANGNAYMCFCTRAELQEAKEESERTGGRQGYNRRCRDLSADEIAEKDAAGLPFVVRLKIPLEGECKYTDAIKGELTIPWADIDDQVLLKSDGFPTYHLANVVDDHLMKITHVIRGDEWIISTPKHISLYRAFGWDHPIFMHMPLLLGKDGRKLSKRRNPTSIFYYRDSGFMPEALVNFLSLMGYSMTGDREIYTLDDFIREFDAKRIGVSGAVFDIQKLEWLNQQYILKNLSEQQLWERLKGWAFNDAFMQKLVPLCHSRLKTFGDFMELCSFFFVNKIAYTDELFPLKRLSREECCMILQSIMTSLEEKESWSGETLSESSREVAECFGVNYKKCVIPILFASIMGKDQGPPLFESVSLLGKDKMRIRFLETMEFLGGLTNKRAAQLKKAWDAKDCKALIGVAI